MVKLIDIMAQTPGTQQGKTPKITPSIVYTTHGRVRPDAPKGYLVQESLLDMPANFIKDTAKDVVFIGKGLTGKANDHQLGKINDIGMKIGGLALATYLFTKNKDPQKKLMEFIGFGTFFASMALWPKLFIQLPIKLIHGIDIHKKYVDSQGDKKMFFQDPQYLPWDIMTHKQIEELGDSMGVPQSVRHRQGITKERARKVAVQGNTLWMWTAGFATPLASALSCFGIGKVLPNILESVQNNKAKAALNNSKGLLSNLADVKGACPVEFTNLLSVNQGVNFGTARKTGTMGKILEALKRSCTVDNIRMQTEKEFQQICKNSISRNGGNIVLDQKMVEDLTHLREELSVFDRVWDGFRKVRNATTQTTMSNRWSKFTETLFGELGIKGADLKKIKEGGKEAEELIIRKIQTAAGTMDAKKYTSMMQRIGAVVKGFDSSVEPVLAEWDSSLQQLGREFNQRFRRSGFDFLAKSVENAAGGIPNVHKQALDLEVNGARSCFYKIIQALDLERRIKTGVFDAQFRELTLRDPQNVPLDKLKEVARQVIYHEQPASYLDKFKTGKSGDFFRQLSIMLFGSENNAFKDVVRMSDDTTAGISTGLTEKIKAFFTKISDNVLNFTNDIHPNQVAEFSRKEHASNSPAIKHVLAGDPVKDIIEKMDSKIFNTNKWLKITATLAGILVGATLFTEMFLIGRNNNKDCKKDV